MDAFESQFLSKALGCQTPDSKQCPMPCGRFPKETPIAMAYVPYQSWETPYDEATALSRATIFPALDKPFIGEEAVKKC